MGSISKHANISATTPPYSVQYSRISGSFGMGKRKIKRGWGWGDQKFGGDWVNAYMVANYTIPNYQTNCFVPRNHSIFKLTSFLRSCILNQLSLSEIESEGINFDNMLCKCTQ